MSAAAGEAISRLGHPDIAVNNAGGRDFMASFLDMRLDGSAHTDPARRIATRARRMLTRARRMLTRARHMATRARHMATRAR